MPTLSSFSLPAFIQDFEEGSPQDRELKARWNTNVSGWIAQAMPAAPSFFYNPVETDIPSDTVSLPVQWNAFPGRLTQYYAATPPNQPANPKPLSQTDIFALADTGYLQSDKKVSFPDIPSVICPKADWTKPLKTFGPYGPRGWLDEYCEWSAARDSDGNLVRVDFCCENPEYWTTLWKISPEKVAALYESTLNWDAPEDRWVTVNVSDLELGVTDPDTGRPAYNPLNKWNSGPVAIRTGDQGSFSGGAMHLTSTPNTLQTELGLAGAATVQYQPPGGTGNSDPQALICCGNYGQEYRNSDPHIGQLVNQVVGGQATGSPLTVCLADPVGLYIQTLTNPSLFTFGSGINQSKLPSGSAASDIFQVVRGGASVIDPVTQSPFPGAMILHAVAQIPSSWLEVYPAMTLADIAINGDAIVWAGQIAGQFDIGLYARPLATSAKPPAASCASTAATPGAPLQCMMWTQLWDAYYQVQETAPTGQTMSLASNTTFIAPRVPANGDVNSLTLPCSTPSGMPSVSVLLADGSGADPDITVKVDGMADIVYAVPGNSFPGPCTALSLSVTVSSGAASGLRTVAVEDPKAGTSSLPAALYIAVAE